MRKKTKIFSIIVIAVLLLTLSGCSSKKIETDKDKVADKVEEEAANVVESKNDSIMKDFRNMVENNNEPMNLIKYIDENIEKVSPEERVEMIEKLEAVQEQYIEKYTDQLFMEDYQAELLSLSGIYQLKPEKEEEIGKYLFFDQSKVEEIKNGNLKELLDKIIQGKYKLINMEGAFYPIIDYEALKVYDKYVSNEMKDYIHIKAMDSNLPTIIDAAFMISFDELGERLITVEKHIIKYPEGIKYEELLRLYGLYLRFYLEGSDNTPIYDYDTNMIKDEVLSSYKKLAKSKDTVTSNIVSKYIDIIEENQFVIDENVFSQITTLHNEAIATLEEHK
ncbi:hypothetical protein [Clostridium sp. Cult3]|uniref:hypothetical protein n=1 Tax=Clostridium sp. Cult3 TaxID=2079004 RepID=UPI001F22AC21|nr:hypothetical protein [Clostridium sp. Cult3]MCF6460250.1 hypothetical protein [Clostridium sp. Cult3]